MRKGYKRAGRSTLKVCRVTRTPGIIMAMDHHSQVLQGRVKREMVAALKNADQQGDWTRRDPDGRMEGLGEDDEFVVDLFVQD